MDSPDWSRTFNVVSISRLYLRSLGFTNEQINSLTDEDMEHIADDLNNGMAIGFEEDLKFTVSIFLTERGAL